MTLPLADRSPALADEARGLVQADRFSFWYGATVALELADLVYNFVR